MLYVYIYGSEDHDQGKHEHVWRKETVSETQGIGLSCFGLIRVNVTDTQRLAAVWK